MAIVADGFVLNVTLMDTAGDTTQLVYNLSSVDIAAANTDSAAIMGSLGSLSKAIITAYQIATKYINNALVYPAACEVEDEAFFSGKIVGHPNKSGNFRLPAPVDAVFNAPEGPGRNIVDVSFPALVTFFGLFDGTGPVTVSDGESLVLTSIQGRRRKKGSKIG